MYNNGPYQAIKKLRWRYAQGSLFINFLFCRTRVTSGSWEVFNFYFFTIRELAITPALFVTLIK